MDNKITYVATDKERDIIMDCLTACKHVFTHLKLYDKAAEINLVLDKILEMKKQSNET